MEKWNLDCFYTVEQLQKKMKELLDQIQELKLLQTEENFSSLIDKIQEIDASLRESDALIYCLQAQDVLDEKANQLRAEFTSVEAEYQVFSNSFETWLTTFSPEMFERLLQDSQIQPIRFILEEKRERAQRKLSVEKENMITTLSIDGYHGWGDLYPSLIAEVKIPFEQGILSVGQAENKLAHPDRVLRQSIFSTLSTVWKERAPVFAHVLNHIAGFRLHIYAKRGWEDPLSEPLFENRMRKETLNAMWNAVAKNKTSLALFMQAKANQLKIDKLSWYDVEAPFEMNSTKNIPYQEGIFLLIEEFGAFHPKMGQFVQKAYEQKWMEVEDRAGKRPGGFCVSFPKSQQSRIFMTYSGTQGNLMTLAHELGHAYHNTMLEKEPFLAHHYPMNIAETASIFAEHVIRDALLQKAKTAEEKREILAERIQRAITFFMNIHARFLFETEFYTLRKNHFLSADELCALMQKAQKEAFANTLEEWHPYFWISKLHFYFTSAPFYHFPYTFGYLFSLGLYARAKKEGKEFGSRYDDLLRESGMMSIETLAKKHLGVDLTQSAFWDEAAAMAVSDVSSFIH